MTRFFCLFFWFLIPPPLLSLRYWSYGYIFSGSNPWLDVYNQASSTEILFWGGRLLKQHNYLIVNIV